MALHDFLTRYFARREDGRAYPIEPPKIQAMDQPKSRIKEGTLAAVIGITAATIVFTQIPMDESGRVVEATVLPDGTAMVKHIRGKQYLRAYLDIAGVATACDGLTRDEFGEPIRNKQLFTEKQCEVMLEKALVTHAKGMMRCTPSLRGEDKDHLRAAGTINTYNIGVNGWCRSSMHRYMEQGDFVRGCNNLLAWNKARVRGVLQPVRGLTLRRNREREICLTGRVVGKTPENLAERIERWR